jgi:hypothetical protein
MRVPRNPTWFFKITSSASITVSISAMTIPTSQEVANARFNTEARNWDANKKHVESCEKAFEAIRKYVPAFADGSSKGMSA